MVDLTVEQAKEYLAALGITVPDFVLTIWVSQANGINDCLSANYDANTSMLIRLYLVALLGISGGDKYISSQTAPSGASQSFRYQALADRWRGTFGLLKALDTAGCATALIPPNPTDTGHAGLWVAKGGCMSGDS